LQITLRPHPLSGGGLQGFNIATLAFGEAMGASFKMEKRRSRCPAISFGKGAEEEMVIE
jgi:hypothetical protein